MGFDWEKLALIHILIGFEADVLGLITYPPLDNRTQGLLIVAFIIYTISVILIAMTKFAEHALDLVGAIFIIIFMISAAALLCAGVGIYGKTNSGNPYPATLEISAALLGLLGAIFLIIRVACGEKHSSTSP